MPMIAYFVFALILLMVMAAIVQDLRLSKKVASIQRSCATLSGRAEQRVLLELRCGARNKPLLLSERRVGTENTSRDGAALTETECDLRLLQFLNLIDTEARGGREIPKDFLRAA
jgi:hypothetical protein